MAPDNPTGVALTDALHNRDMLIIGSELLRAVIEAEAGPHMEYLPVAVYNHKKRQIPEAYTIIHPLNPVDCLEIDACQVRWGRIDKNDIARLKQLVIDESRIDESSRAVPAQALQEHHPRTPQAGREDRRRRLHGRPLARAAGLPGGLTDAERRRHGARIRQREGS